MSPVVFASAKTRLIRDGYLGFLVGNKDREQAVA